MRWLAIACIASLAACNSEPDFDEKFEATEKQLRETASEIDAELEERRKAREPAEKAERAAPADEPVPETPKA